MKKGIKNSVLFLRENLFGAIALGLFIESILLIHYRTPNKIAWVLTFPGFFVSGIIMFFFNFVFSNANKLRLFSFFGAFFNILFYIFLGAVIQSKFFKKKEKRDEFDFFYVPGFELSDTPLKK